MEMGIYCEKKGILLYKFPTKQLFMSRLNWKRHLDGRNEEITELLLSHSSTALRAAYKWKTVLSVGGVIGLAKTCFGCSFLYHCPVFQSSFVTCRHGLFPCKPVVMVETELSSKNYTHWVPLTTSSVTKSTCPQCADSFASKSLTLYTGIITAMLKVSFYNKQFSSIWDPLQ